MQPINDVAIQSIPFIASIFCVAAMFAMGLNVTFDELILPLRNWRVLAIIILANQILLPFIVLMVTLLPNLLTDESIPDTLIEAVLTYTPNQQSGLLLMAMAAGTFTAPLWAQIAHGKVRLAHGTMVVLVLASALLLPFELRLVQLLSIFEDDVLGKLRISELYGTILFYQLLPLGIGIAIKGWYDSIAVRLRPLIVQFTGLAFLALLSAMLMTGNPFVRMPDTPLSENKYLFDIDYDAAVSRSLNEGMIAQSLRDGFNTAETELSDQVDVLTVDPTNRWQLLDRDKNKLFLVTRAGQVMTVNSYTNFHSYLTETVTGEEFFARMDAKEIAPFQLANALTENRIDPDDDLVVAPTTTVSDTWTITNGDSIYRGQRDGNELKVTANDAAADAEPLFVVDADATQREFFTVLNRGFVPLTLQVALTGDSDAADPALKAEVGSNRTEWRLVINDERYSVRRSGEGAAIHTRLDSPIPLVTDFLANLETPVSLATIGTFLQPLVSLAMPLIFYLVMSVVFLIIGYFSGIFVQSMVNKSGVAIPRTLATTTAVRNVSMVLIIVVMHITRAMTNSDGETVTGVDLGVLAAVLTFFLTNLLVAGYIADRWHQNPGPPEQDLAALAAEKDELVGKIEPASAVTG